jgi:hypothetical protein
MPLPQERPDRGRAIGSVQRRALCAHDGGLLATEASLSLLGRSASAPLNSYASPSRCCCCAFRSCSGPTRPRAFSSFVRAQDGDSMELLGEHSFFVRSGAKPHSWSRGRRRRPNACYVRQWEERLLITSRMYREAPTMWPRIRSKPTAMPRPSISR